MAAEPDEAPTSFTTVPGDPGSPWILHVPHASTRIPAAVRARIVLDDGQLDAELRAMTDAHTDRLAARSRSASRRAGPGRSSTACRASSSTPSASPTSGRS